MFDVVSSSKWPTGYLINPNVEPLDPKWLTEFSKIPAAAVSDCLGRNVGGLGLKPFHDAGKCVKPLFLGKAQTFAQLFDILAQVHMR